MIILMLLLAILTIVILQTQITDLTAAAENALDVLNAHDHTVMAMTAPTTTIMLKPELGTHLFIAPIGGSSPLPQSYVLSLQQITANITFTTIMLQNLVTWTQLH
jgi:hypothetical protein